jgi:hypothetical protein
VHRPLQAQGLPGEKEKMPISFSTNGWYIARVDTGIGEQYASVQITMPSAVAGMGIAATVFDPMDAMSAHYIGLVSGPAATAEEAWATWRTSSAPTHFKVS